MRLTIERGALMKALGHVQSVVERRNTIPILSNVLIEARDGSVTFAATDLDIEIVDGADADVERAGATTVQAHLLYEIVRKLPDGAQVRLDLSPDDPRVTITAGRGRYNLPVLAAGDFPAMSTGSFDARFSLERAALARLLDRTRFAISTEETRYYLNGVYLHSAIGDSGPCLRAVATDGHRLALADHPTPAGAAEVSGVIIPRKTVGELRRLLDDAGDEVEIGVSEAKIQFSFGRTTLTSKLIDGTFPPYSKVIPKGNSRIMSVRNDEFSRAVDRVATMAAERSRSVKLSVGDGKVMLAVNSPETGAATEEVEADYNSEALEIGFNAKYLLDIASQIGNNEARFEFADAASPTLVRDGSDPNALFVLMPLRV
jgi:DNA polymerase III subunit beta